MPQTKTFFLSSVVLLAFLQAIPLASSSSLYKPDDPLWELDSTNFERIVYGKNTAWIIEFYNAWCGYCIRFAPKYREFARDIENWKNVIEVGAVNCVDSENVKLCREYHVEGYPTIKLFPPNLNSTEKGKLFIGERGLSRIRHQIIDFLELQENAPSQWPNFKEVEATSTSELWASLPSNVNTAYIFIEHSDSYVGREVILDLSMQKHLTVLRVLTSNTQLLHQLVENFDNSTSTFLKITRDGSKEVLNIFETSVNSTAVRDLVYETLTGQTRVKVDDETDDKDIEDKTVKKGVYMVDLENAVRYVLWQEVGVHSDISGPQFAALKNFVATLRMYFPGSPAVKGFLIKLNTWLDQRKANMTGERFVSAMDKLQTENEYIPKMREYVGCKGSTAKYRGYPCSLWTLFHTLTVQAYNAYERKSDKKGQQPQDVLFAIRGYVKHYFSCRECSLHFQKMSANLEEEVKVPKDTVMWLWQAHNKVNKRLAGDATEDPVHPKIQFPDKDSCQKCRIRTNGDDIEWDKNAVLRYLQYFYKNENIVPATSDAKQQSTKNIDADGFRLPSEITNFNGETDSGKQLSDYSLALPFLPLLNLLSAF